MYESEEIIYSKSLAAWEIRQKARQDAHKLRGDYPAEATEHRFPNGVPVQIGTISPQDQAALTAAMEAWLNAKYGPQTG